MVEVLDASPSSLTDGERLLLLALAEWANDDSRACWPGLPRLVERMGRSEEAVAKLLRGLARKGLECRIPMAYDARAGRHVFAGRGHQTTYAIPHLAEVAARCACAICRPTCEHCRLRVWAAGSAVVSPAESAPIGLPDRQPLTLRQPSEGEASGDPHPSVRPHHLYAHAPEGVSA